MKVKIKSFNGELPSYLELGKEYEIEHISQDGSYFICTDEIDYVCIRLDGCNHLNGGSWEIVK